MAFSPEDGAFGPVRTVLNGIPGLPLGDILLGKAHAFKRGFVFEIIDQKRPNDSVAVKSLVLNPQRYLLSEPFAVTLTPTEDDTVVSEENGLLIREILIEGTTGLQKRKEDALGRGGAAGTEASGVDHFRELRALFRKYGELKKNPEKSPSTIMVFHDVRLDEHWVVVPRAFETPRDAATGRVHFNYRIALAAISAFPPPKPATHLPGVFGQIADAVSKLNSAVHDSRAFLVETINNLDAISERVRDPSRMLEQAAKSINSVAQLVDGVATLIELGVAFHRSTTDLLEAVREDIVNSIDSEPAQRHLEAARAIARIEASLTLAQTEPQAFEPPLAQAQLLPFAGERNLTAADVADGTAGATVGTRTRLALGSEGQAGLDLGGFTGSRRDSVRAGDSIDTIANRTGAPREALIVLNNLSFPYVSEQRLPGCLKPGDSVLVPVATSASVQGLPPTGVGYLSVEDLVYGVDMALDPAQLAQGVLDIAVDELHGARDCQLQRGLPNVVQGLSITLLTELGTTSFLPQLGVRRTPGVRGSLENVLLSAAVLREGILSDPRVSGIESMRVVLEGDVLSQEITAAVRDAREGVTLVVPFGTVGGG